MGRPYVDELATLGDTFGYALAAEIADLKQGVDELRSRPLIVIGSGGSVSACHVAARLHVSIARLPARVMTPLEFMRRPLQQSAGVLLLSASGRNPDILAAASHAVRAEYGPIVGISTRSRTLLRERLRPFRHATVLEFVGPSRKDGFLATNSLLLTSALLTRSYGLVLPALLPALTQVEISKAPNVGSDRSRSGMRKGFLESLARPHIVVLADGWSTPAAIDLESKWSELGFGAVTVTDARNFAHGRHYGLSRRFAETLVLGLATPEALPVLQQTLKHLPPEAAVANLQTSMEGAAGALDLMVQVLQITGSFAATVGVDPGRPRVPGFGRALYRARMPQRSRGDSLASDAISVSRKSLRSTAGDARDLWIRRKVSTAVWSGASREIREGWREQRDEWVAATDSLRVGGVVLDYDGTLCETDERFTTPSVQVGAELSRLIDDGMLIGVATGRGGSVLEALGAIIPERLWPRVIVGLYNGGVLRRLEDQTGTSRDVAPSIRQARELIEASMSIASIATSRERPTQLTVQARYALPEGLLLRFVREALGATGDAPDVNVFSSGHTVDVIAGGISKVQVVDAVRKELASVSSLGRARAGSASCAQALSIMTVGDQGCADGNDFSFLAHPLGLSVENASSNLTSCWNVAPPGSRRTTALLRYLSALRKRDDGGFAWSVAIASSSVRGAFRDSEKKLVDGLAAAAKGRGVRKMKRHHASKESGK
jgi:fructoselysine-6-P-deglycase FrlB-like protein